MSAECSRCGQTPDIEMDVICASKTKWGYEPQAPTTIGTIKAATVDTIVDQEKRWRLRLCNKCLIMGYIDHLQRSIYGDKKFLTWASLVLFVSLGILALIIFYFVPKLSLPPEGLFWLIPAIPFLAAIVCIIGIPITAVELLRNNKRFKKVKTISLLPKKNIRDAFDGEAHRILESLEKGRKDYHGNYDLPQYSSGMREGRTRGTSFREITIIVPNKVEEDDQ